MSWANVSIVVLLRTQRDYGMESLTDVEVEVTVCGDEIRSWEVTGFRDFPYTEWRRASLPTTFNMTADEEHRALELAEDCRWYDYDA